MPIARVNGFDMYYEVTGSGKPILFIHEFASDSRSWEPQVRHFSRRYQCITYNARGYPPSGVVEDPSNYSLEIAVEDARCLLSALNIRTVAAVGLSMGSFTALRLALLHPDLVSSVLVAGCGYGSLPDSRDAFQKDCLALAEKFESLGSAAVAEFYCKGASRVGFREKDERGWAELREHVAALSPKGAALTLRGIQAKRPSLFEWEQELKAMRVPLLVLTGDFDDWTIEPSWYLKRIVPTAGLCVLPRTGHTVNLEEPALFNQHLQNFLWLAEAEKWGPRASIPFKDFY